MASLNNDQVKMSSEEETFLRTIHAPSGVVLCMAMKTAIELDLFELIAKGGPNAQLSAYEIAKNLSTKNPEAPIILDRILRFLTTQSYFNCKLITDENGGVKRVYSLGPLSKFAIRNEDGASLSPLLLHPMDKAHIHSWYHLKDTILEGGTAFERANGVKVFEHVAKDNTFGKVFNNAMYNHSAIVMKKVVEVYKGFEGVKELVDVGGGLGASLASILSKYPKMKGINYDLPHVIQNALRVPGVEYIGGDMFESVPKGETIFMKWILHDWSDDACLKLLKNCWKALPKSGKVIVIDEVLPETPKTDVISTIGHYMDLFQMTFNSGGKERTKKELETLTKQAGFATLNLVCPAYNYWVMELCKN